MRAVVLAFLVSCSSWASSGSVYRSSGPCPVHVGVRPAVDGPQGGVTVQVSADPGCVDRPTPAEQRILDDMAASAARSEALGGDPGPLSRLIARCVSADASPEVAADCMARVLGTDRP